MGATVGEPVGDRELGEIVDGLEFGLLVGTTEAKDGASVGACVRRTVGERVSNVGALVVDAKVGSAVKLCVVGFGVGMADVTVLGAAVGG